MTKQKKCTEGLLSVSPPQRIGMVLTALGGGGAERTVLTLAKSLQERGYQIDLVLLRLCGSYQRTIPNGVRIYYRDRKRTTDPMLLQYCYDHNIATHPLAVNLLATFNGWRNLRNTYPGARIKWAQVRAARAVARYIREAKPALLFSALPSANCAALLGTQISSTVCRTPVIMSVHNNVDKSASYQARENQGPGTDATNVAFSLMHTADAVVAVSRGVAETVIKTLGVDKEKVHPIYNPIPVSEIRRMAEQTQDVRHPWFFDSDIPIVTSVLSPGDQKDYRTLVLAFALVRQKLAVRLVILGNLSVDYRNQVSFVARELGVEEDIRFLGFVENPFGYMHRAALHVLSSRYEGLSNVLIEAMACGTPVVSTDAPYGPSEILDGGRWGRLVPVGDAEALSVAMIETLEHGVVSKEELKLRADKFSTERLVPMYEKLFGTVILNANDIAAKGCEFAMTRE